MRGEILDRFHSDALSDTATHYLGVFPRDQVPRPSFAILLHMVLTLIQVLSLVPTGYPSIANPRPL